MSHVKWLMVPAQSSQTAIATEGAAMNSDPGCLVMQGELTKTGEKGGPGSPRAGEEGPHFRRGTKHNSVTTRCHTVENASR